MITHLVDLLHLDALNVDLLSIDLPDIELPDLDIGEQVDDGEFDIPQPQEGVGDKLGDTSEGVERILGITRWGALAVTVVALMIAGARMGFGSRQGDGEEHASRIGQVLLGVVIVSGAWAIISFAFTGTSPAS